MTLAVTGAACYYVARSRQVGRIPGMPTLKPLPLYNENIYTLAEAQALRSSLGAGAPRAKVRVALRRLPAAYYYLHDGSLRDSRAGLLVRHPLGASPKTREELADMGRIGSARRIAGQRKRAEEGLQLAVEEKGLRAGNTTDAFAQVVKRQALIAMTDPNELESENKAQVAAVRIIPAAAAFVAKAIGHDPLRLEAIEAKREGGLAEGQFRMLFEGDTNAIGLLRDMFNTVRTRLHPQAVIDAEVKPADEE